MFEVEYHTLRPQLLIQQHATQNHQYATHCQWIYKHKWTQQNWETAEKSLF